MGWSIVSLDQTDKTVHQIPGRSLALIFTANDDFNFRTSFDPQTVSISRHDFSILAFPRADWEIKFDGASKDARMLILDLDVMHQFIGASYNAGEKNRDRFRLPKQPMTLSAKLRLPLLELFDCNFLGACGILFRESKIMEFFSLLLLDLQNGKPDIDACPFLEDETEANKIHEAKNILIRDFHLPNKIKDLAREVGTNEYKLKVGFKHLFGTSIHSFLIDQRMENARIFLSKSGTSVSQVSEMVGYSNPSHFIEAFKKKFGVTPKKMLAS